MNFELKRKVYYLIFISLILKNISFAGNIDTYMIKKTAQFLFCKLHYCLT